MSRQQAAELQALIECSLTEGEILDRQMAEDQQRIERLKEETRLIAAETQYHLERLQEELAALKASA